MSAQKFRGLRPEEEHLWRRVADGIVPLHPPRRPCAPARPQSPRKDAVPDALPAIARFAIDFRVGANAPFTAPRHDLAPSTSARLADAPLRMDRKAFMRMGRGKLAPEGRIDLHGMTLSAAHPALNRFVMSAHGSGKRLLLVITGKGRQGPDDGPIPQRPGVLKHQVPQWLSSSPLAGVVLQVTEAHQRHGGSGAYYVYLRRAR